MRVLYVHGLEGGPGGKKCRTLRKDPRFDVTAPDMSGILKRGRSFAHPRMKVAFVTALLFLLVPLFVLYSCVYHLDQSTPLSIYLAGSSLIQRVQLVTLSCSLSLFAICYAFRWAFSGVVEECIAVVSQAIKETSPDVVIGSSFGGGITLWCMQRNLYTGPVLLLAPAQARLTFFTLLDVPRIPSSYHQPVTIYHSFRDPIVSIYDSTELLQQSNSADNDMHHLVVVDDNHALHSLTTSLPSIVRNFVQK
eukprot:TRINITY_DN10975_c0_g1_i1.p1 TRINITY_DN10975_c0_g1~~TRINITY_DN10975_c0_g1_i1.p1  ORF type:complete len:262 (-),score=29.66 TRINITY_DN10975_c0_g1_i1:100-849(-)